MVDQVQPQSDFSDYAIDELSLNDFKKQVRKIKAERKKLRGWTRLASFKVVRPGLWGRSRPLTRLARFPKDSRVEIDSVEKSYTITYSNGCYVFRLYTAEDFRP